METWIGTKQNYKLGAFKWHHFQLKTENVSLTTQEHENKQIMRAQVFPKYIVAY